jgi:uncharacterized protein
MEMKYSKLTHKADYIVKLEVGDKVHEAILDFCAKEGVETGWITGLGAIKDISLGYYNLNTKQYGFQKYSEIYEVMGLIGNIALVDNKPFLHIHTSISDENNQTFSGHLEFATVAVTLELRITAYRESISRLFEDAVGLRLLQCIAN